jgi:transposase InsO family protein
LENYGKPEIFNTNQGSQFTSPRFTEIVKDARVCISMDGRGRWVAYYNTQPPHSDEGRLGAQRHGSSGVAPE